MKLLHALLVCLAAAAPVMAYAQWQYIDKDGRKVFSDQPPPPGIPEKNVLKQPGPRPALPADGGAAASAAKPATAGALKPSATDPQLDAARKQAEAAQAEKRKGEEQKVAKSRSDNCQRAKQAKATYDSGVRVSRSNAKGEREILDDAARSAEVKRLESIMAMECGPAPTPQ